MLSCNMSPVSVAHVCTQNSKRSALSPRRRNKCVGRWVNGLWSTSAHKIKLTTNRRLKENTTYFTMFVSVSPILFTDLTVSRVARWRSDRPASGIFGLLRPTHMYSLHVIKPNRLLNNVQTYALEPNQVNGSKLAFFFINARDSLEQA